MPEFPPENSSPGLPAAGPPPSEPGGLATDDVHILDRLAILYRYRGIAISVFVLTTGFALLQGYSNLQLYRAQARLLIENERSTAVPGLATSQDAYYEDPEPYYQTQYRILKGRDLTRSVLKRLDLRSIPQFPGSASPSSPMTLVRGLRQRVLRIVRGVPSAPAEPPQVDETADESALVDWFLSAVSVDPVRGSRLVDVSFQCPDPQFAARAVNALAEVYVDQNLQSKLQATDNMIEWLSGELEKQQKKVEESERALAEYRDKQNALSLDDKQNIVVARLTQINEALIRAKTTRVQREALFNQVRSMSATAAPDAIPVIAQNAQVQSLKTHLAELQQTRVRLAERYGEKHPEILKVNSALQDTQHQLDLEISRALQSVRNEYETSVLEEQTLSRNLEAAKADAEDLNRKNIGYSVMEHEANSNRQVYEALLQRGNELRVSSNSRSNNIRIIDRAEVPKAPMTPSGQRTLLMSLAIGLIAAIGAAYGLDYMNDTIKTPEDVTQRLKVPFLGLLPSVRREDRPILASSRVPHEFGEAFRALRTALIAQYPGEGTKILMVTSSQPLEGKTTTACNIAIALAYGGARVLLIDADMRRPGMHRPMKLVNDRGLSQVLVGQARVRDVIQRTIDPNLLAITAGHPPPNPSELLASIRMKRLLSNLSYAPFDWIVVDTPPVLAVTDAVVLAPHVTGVAFVVGAEMTRRRLAERALDTILQSRPKAIAAVLNKVDLVRNRYYYSRYYGHQYKRYYEEAAS
jgi:polysaccharide biosynthesis transport protein